jgi:hypothetical protein
MRYLFEVLRAIAAYLSYLGYPSLSLKSWMKVVNSFLSCCLSYVSGLSLYDSTCIAPYL